MLVMLFVMVFLLQQVHQMKENKKEVRTDMKHSVTKDGAVFLLEIQHRQNATWQGSITWVDRQNKQYFRSALELIKLIDSALDQSVEEEREGEESGYEEEQQSEKMACHDFMYDTRSEQ